MVDHALGWLSHVSEPPPFFDHVYDAHDPQDRQRRSRVYPSQPYDGEIAYVDHALGSSSMNWEARPI